MLVFPAMVIAHSVGDLRQGYRRGLRLGYLGTSLALIVYFLAIYMHQQASCVRSG
jgi:hypothetical protein